MSQYPIRVGLHIPAKPPLRDLNLLMRVARLAGIDTGIVWDHFQDFIPQRLWREDQFWLAKDRPLFHEHYEWQVLLGYLAGRAGGMRLGVGVTEPLRRHPVMIAQAMMTLAHMTKRPPILGIGAGERQNTLPYGVSMEKAVSKLEEALQIIRLCFTSTGTFDFAGEHFQLTNAVMDLQLPPGKSPPIWVAAHGPRMLRLTGQYGDGWYPGDAGSPELYGDRMQTIRNHAREAGRDPARISGALVASVVIAPSDEEARACLTMPSMRFLGLMLSDQDWQRFGLTHPLGEGFRGYPDILPEEIDEEELDDALGKVPEELLLESYPWGSPDSLAARFREYGKAGLQQIVITPIAAITSRRLYNYMPRGLWNLRRKLA
jgi:phthiodiolone/phenolphthiodiolone dimycocerosates ketoreductase